MDTAIANSAGEIKVERRLQRSERNPVQPVSLLKNKWKGKQWRFNSACTKSKRHPKIPRPISSTELGHFEIWEFRMSGAAAGIRTAVIGKAARNEEAANFLVGDAARWIVVTGWRPPPSRDWGSLVCSLLAPSCAIGDIVLGKANVRVYIFRVRFLQ